MLYRKLLCLSGLVTFCLILSAKENETSLRPDLAHPPLRNYILEDYGLQPQNWAITQDILGQMIFANQGGILRYDGRNWEQLPLPGISALALLSQGNQLVAAGQKTVGYLQDTAQGSLKYREVPCPSPIGRVYRLHRYGPKTIIQAQEGFFLLYLDKIMPFFPNLSIRRVFECHGNIYFQTLDGTLFSLVDGQPETLATLDPRNDIITWISTLDEGNLLLATHKNGLFLLEKGQKKPFYTELNEYLSQNTIMSGIRLSSGDIALATRLGGLVIMDEQGTRRWLLTKESGLQSNTIYCLYEDREHNLWIGLNYGIAKLELDSGFLLFSKSSAIPEMALSVTHHDGRIWLGTASGLISGGPREAFTSIQKVPSNVWDLESSPHGLLCASSSGLFLIHSQNEITTLSPQPMYIIQKDLELENTWYCASEMAIHQIQRNTRGWRIDQISPVRIPNCRSMGSLKANDLWCGSEGDGLWHLYRNDTSWEAKFYGEKEGAGNQARISVISNELWLVSDGMLKRFSPQDNIFVLNRSLGDEYVSGRKTIFNLIEAPDLSIWSCVSSRIEQFTKTDEGKYLRRKTPYLRVPPRQINQIHIHSQMVYFATIDGLIAYRKENERKQTVFECHVKQLRFGTETQFGIANIPKAVPYKNRDLEITLFAPFFQHEQSNRYQFKLEGLENNWSPWQESPVIRFTNLPGGHFALRARARNVFEEISKETRLTFNIRHPWYQHPAAYAFYLILLALLGGFIVQWRTARLAKEKKELEAIVSARTEEINRQKDQLTEQAEKLQELDQLKSRFFANISHEFRTPLTLISGPVETLVSKVKDPIAAATLRNIRHQADRLLDLVNQLLELARFESGQNELIQSPLDLLGLLKGLFFSFDSLAVQKGIQLQFNSTLRTLPATLDQEKTERLILNLIGNALKFTPQGGTVTLQLSLENNLIEIIVSDTGRGIPEEKLEHIFDRFTRIGRQNGIPGSGIGLALAREIVTVHQGSIHAENRPEGGCRFIVRLPWIKPDGTELISLNDSPRLQAEKAFSIHESVPIVQKRVNKSRHLILLIEDNMEVSNYIQGILQDDYRLVSAANGETGIQMARAHMPDLIISDVMMPVKDGWELCRSLKSDVSTSHIPIVLLTARGGEDSQMKGYQLGADDYITKPFSPSLLMARIDNLIHQRQELQKVLRRHFLTEPQQIDVNSTEEQFLKEVAEILEANFADPLFHVEALQQKLYMGRTTLYRKLLALTGESPSQFLRSFRMSRAAQFFQSGHGNVTEISIAVGFTNPAYFSECFKQKFGVNPSQYMEQSKIPS